MLQSIRSVHNMIRTPLIPQIVQGHRDRHVPLSELTHIESSNYECDLLSKYACTLLQPFKESQPTLRLPFETAAIWYKGTKIYKDFNNTIIEKCSLPWTRQYFTNKYNWTNDDFNSINWGAIKTAMTLCSFSART